MVVRRAFFAILTAVSLGACAVPGPGEAPDGIFDPNEVQNRKVHAFNQKIDEKILRGSGSGYSEVVPAPVKAAVSNVADTLSTPQTVVNQILQGRLGRAAKNTLRFSLNATVGLAGVLDPASDLGLPKDDSDFGETLHVWGVPEGSYIVLPFLGPSTERDLAGDIVDLVTDPFDYILTVPEGRAKTVINIADKVGDRGRFSDTVDDVLYESADGYAQLRLIYLQNRRFELGQAAPVSEEIDPLALDTEGF